jgi:NADH-quinone oxidoreductase subunit C
MEFIEEQNIIEELKKALGDENILGFSIPRSRRIFINIKIDGLRDAIKHLCERGFEHISTISGVDVEDGIEVIYHLTRQKPNEGITLSIRVKVPYGGSLPSIVEIIPGAVLYEREVHDLLGVAFEGHPDLSRVILPDDWPDDIHPLLKRWSPEEIRKRLMEIGKN